METNILKFVRDIKDGKLATYQITECIDKIKNDWKQEVKTEIINELLIICKKNNN